VGSDDGNVYALGLADGKKGLGLQRPGAGWSPSPLVLEGKVFVGSSDGFAFTRWEAATGKLAWKYETGDKILGGPNWVKMGAENGADVSPAAPGIPLAGRVLGREERRSGRRPAPLRCWWASYGL